MHCRQRNKKRAMEGNRRIKRLQKMVGDAHKQEVRREKKSLSYGTFPCSVKEPSCTRSLYDGDSVKTIQHEQCGYLGQVVPNVDQLIT